MIDFEAYSSGCDIIEHRRWVIKRVINSLLSLMSPYAKRFKRSNFIVSIAVTENVKFVLYEFENFIDLRFEGNRSQTWDTKFEALRYDVVLGTYSKLNVILAAAKALLPEVDFESHFKKIAAVADKTE